MLAHPPCQRWGRYATGGPNPRARRRFVGDDDGCFASALASVRRFRGVLEHPEGSHAWVHFGLPRPPRIAWSEPDAFGGRSCRVDQGRYGHPARKATWLYAVLPEYPELDWSRAAGRARLDVGAHSKEEAAAIRSAPGYMPPRRLTRAECELTPSAFADLLIGMAETALQATMAPRAP